MIWAASSQTINPFLIMWQIETLLTDLINTASPTGNETAVLQLLTRTFGRLGLQVQSFPVAPERFNLLAGWESSPDILLTTHCDTVPPHILANISDGRIYGRGACDAKGALVAMLHALANLPEYLRWRAGLLVVIGEETDSCGAQTFLEEHYPARFIINGEPTGNQLVSAQKGVLIFELSANGVAVHSGYPAHGKSAISLLLSQLAKLEALDWGDSPTAGKATVNIGKISGGEAANTLAERATATVCVRLVDDAATAISLLNTHLLPDVTLEIIAHSDPVELFVPTGFNHSPVSFGSDAAYFSQICPTMMVGPGNILDAHTPNESVAISELYAASEIYQRLIATLAAETPAIARPKNQSQIL